MSSKFDRCVVIPTAGKGSRVGEISKVLNKALLPLNDRAIISHIIDKFPQGTHFVIALGYMGDQVKAYLSLAHPGIEFKFVNVDNFDGPGSGPGYTLTCCREYLQRPFYFVACDTLWENPIDFELDSDWFGVASVPAESTRNYCNFEIRQGEIVGIFDKQPVSGPNFKAFVGLCYVKSHEIFWKALSEGKLIAGEHQVSNGITALVNQVERPLAVQVDWTDVGTEEQYKSSVARYQNFDFAKSNEALYIVNDRVIKFFAEEHIAKKRVEKASLNSKVFPQIIELRNNFYSYNFAKGETLYKRNNIEIFKRLLSWLESELWEPCKIDHNTMKEMCLNFYRQKTFDRLQQYFTKYQAVDEANCVNGVQLPRTYEMLECVNWNELAEGIPVFFHGDLQFDNILYDIESDKFTLLDWRQEFAGKVELGDLYYDLAKLLGGITLNYDCIKLNLFSYEERNGEVFIDHASRVSAAQYVQQLEDFVRAKGLNFERVKILRALIFLNMSPLHHYPFDRFLYSLGRLLLGTEVKA